MVMPSAEGGGIGQGNSKGWWGVAGKGLGNALGLPNSLNLLGSQFPYLFSLLSIQRLPVFLIGPQDVLVAFLEIDESGSYTAVCLSVHGIYICYS